MKQAATSEQSSRPRLDAARAQMEQMERSRISGKGALVEIGSLALTEHVAVLEKLKMELTASRRGCASTSN